jgi:hypothetical protein
MSQEKSLIESLKSKTGGKWASMVSRKLIGVRRKDKDLSVDVRLLEFVDGSLWALLSDRKQYLSTVESNFKSFLGLYDSDTTSRNILISQVDTVQGAMHLERIFDLYTSRFASSYSVDNVFSIAPGIANNVTGTIEGVDSAVQSKTTNVLITAYSSLVSTARMSFIDQTQYKAMVIGILKDLLDNWIAQAKQNGWRFDYAVSLSASGLRQASETNLDFTVLDQIRFVNYYESTRIFVYVGGFLDPILKNTVNKDGAKVYLTGAGFGWGPVYVTVSAGIEYPNVVLKNTRFGLSFGYEIPVTDLLD